MPLILPAVEAGMDSTQVLANVLVGSPQIIFIFIM